MPAVCSDAIPCSVPVHQSVSLPRTLPPHGTLIVLIALAVCWARYVCILNSRDLNMNYWPQSFVSFSTNKESVIQYNPGRNPALKSERVCGSEERTPLSNCYTYLHVFTIMTDIFLDIFVFTNPGIKSGQPTPSGTQGFLKAYQTFGVVHPTPSRFGAI